jgi:TolA-binding protein
MNESPQLRELGRRVASVQDEWLERSSSLDSARDGFLLRAGAARHGRRALWLVAAAVAMGAMLSAGVFFVPRLVSERPVLARVKSEASSQGSFIHSNAAERLPIDFSDGSRITLEPGSRVRIAELRPTGATLAVESGALDVSVKHQQKTDYRLSLGPFLVRVTGTRFNVSFSPEQELLRVTMSEGTVVVSGCALGDPRPLRAGETLISSCRDKHFEITSGSQTTASPVPAAAVATREPTPAVGPSRDAVAPAAPRRVEGETPWQVLARSGKYDKALSAVEANGFAAECERASGEELSLLADMARLKNRPQQAIQALGVLRRRFPGSERAGVAAFNIARVHFDQRGAYDEAARWFRTYLREQPSGPLVREAQGRLMEALYRSGDRDGAARLAEQYLAANPNGPHARVAHTLLGR